MHVASLEVVLVDTVIGQYIESCSLCLGSGSEDAQRLVAIEEVGSLPNLRADGSAVDLVVDKLCTLGQFGNLVFVMTHAGAHLPQEILHGKHLDVSSDIEAFVLQLTAVREVLVQTAEEA